MKKILVIGSCGAGKSTFARRLHEITKLELIHLDRIYWQPGWVETPVDVWKKRVGEVLKGDNWIIDGNYGGTMEMRIEACDAVIWLDFPRTLCTWRVIKRSVVYKNKTRPDMAEGCGERFDWNFIKYVWNFRRDKYPLMKKRLKRHPDKKVFRLRSKKEVEEFLGSCR